MQIDGVRGKGELLAEVSFFFRLRHLYTATVGKASTSLFKLTYEDYQQLSASYVDDADIAITQVISNLEASGGAANKSQSSVESTGLSGDNLSNASKVRKTINAAIKRQSTQMVASFLDFVAENDLTKMEEVLDAGKLGVDDMDDGGRTALHIACSRGHLDAVRLLMDKYTATQHVRCASHFSCFKHRSIH
jgi:hypothetical protein